MGTVEIPEELLTDKRVSAEAVRLYALLVYPDYTAGTWLTTRRLAEKVEVTDQTIRRLTKSLEAAGYLWVFKDRNGLVSCLPSRSDGKYPKPNRKIERKRAIDNGYCPVHGQQLSQVGVNDDPDFPDLAGCCYEDCKFVAFAVGPDGPFEEAPESLFPF